MFTQTNILNDPSYIPSHVIVKDIAKNVSTFHHHFHILLPILNLLKAQRYLEIGAYAGASTCLAAHCPSLKSIQTIDTCTHLTDQANKIRNNFAQYNSYDIILELIIGSSQDVGILRKLLQQAPKVDVLFINESLQPQDLMHDFIWYEPLVRPGGLIVFDDYQNSIQNSIQNNEHHLQVRTAIESITSKLSEWNLIGCLPNSCHAFGYDVATLPDRNNCYIIQKPTIPSIESLKSPIFFGIVMATYRRKTLQNPIEPLQTALKSVLAQEYKHWRVFLVGDHYEDDEELRSAISALEIPTDRIVVVNLPIACERDFMKDMNRLWANGGITAMNYALELIEQSGIKYTAHLDDDDTWDSKHLTALAEIYDNKRDPSFVFSHGLVINVNRMILPPKGSRYCESPTPCYVLHSSVSWRLDRIPLRYQETDQPADAELWTRITKFCNQKKLNFGFTGKITISHYRHLPGK